VARHLPPADIPFTRAHGRRYTLLPIPQLNPLEATRRAQYDSAVIRIYGIAAFLDPIKAELSSVINDSMVAALKFPPDKRAHRFFPMAKEDYFTPAGRSDAYLVIEINLMAGRSEQARKDLIKVLFSNIEERLGILPIDVEIMIFESPPCNFGFRGMTGDEAQLNYRIDV
jgi:hypothetical protein